MSFWTKRKFKRLQLAWYRALKEDGFHDIEPGPDLNVERSRRIDDYKNMAKLVRDSKTEYYLLLSQGLYEHEIKSPRDKLIMTRLADGHTIRQITTELQGLGVKCHRQTIRYIKRKYESLWGIRRWAPHQLTSNRKSTK